MKKWLLKRLGVRLEGLDDEQRERCAETIERAACALEAPYASPWDPGTLAIHLRVTGLELIDVASRPYAPTPVRVDAQFEADLRGDDEAMSTERKWTP